MSAKKLKMHRTVNLPKSGVDNFGRSIINEKLYKHTAQLVGLPEEFVEEIVMFVGRYCATAIESNVYLDVMIPYFGKFKSNSKKMFKREKKMMEYTQPRILSKSTQDIINEMRNAGLVKNKGSMILSINNQTIHIPTVVTPIDCVRLYRRGVFSREHIQKLFGQDQEIWNILVKEMDISDNYKKKQDAKTL